MWLIRIDSDERDTWYETIQQAHRMGIVRVDFYPGPELRLLEIGLCDGNGSGTG